MSNEDKFFPEDKKLEAELRRLMPSRLKVDFLDELARDRDRIAAQKKSQGKVRSKWVIPTMAACLLVLVGMTYWKIRGASLAAGHGQTVEENETALLTAGPAADSGPAMPSRLVPVSSQGFLIKASSGGIIDSAQGPQERFQLDFEDVDIWHDPRTSTNIRIFSPRRETLVVPLETY